MSLQGTNGKTQGKHWLITLNNPSVDEYECWHYLQRQNDVVVYHTWQCEVGETGTFHLQGALGCSRAMRARTLHKLRGLQRAHFVPAHDPKGAIAYCSKDESRATASQLEAHFGRPLPVDGGAGSGVGPFSYGELPMGRQGKRNDLKSLLDRVVDGESDYSLLMGPDAATAMRYHKHTAWAREVLRREAAKKPRDITVEVFVGPTGSGKSHTAYYENPDAYRVMRPSKGGTVWFDGYDGEDTIILDDFRGNWMPYDHLLRILDKWPLTEQSKGGTRAAGWSKVVITSTHPPGVWYEAVEFAGGELARRITKTRVFPEAAHGLQEPPLPTVSEPVPPPAEVVPGTTGAVTAVLLQKWAIIVAPTSVTPLDSRDVRQAEVRVAP